MDFPPEVDEHYQRLAKDRGWPPEAKKAFLESVVWIRGLDEGSLSRSYYDRVDDEGAIGKGARWLWEAAESDGYIVAIKQIEVSPGGSVRRYSWHCLEDADGRLTDQPLSPNEDGLRTITRDEFYAMWSKG
jgi:hypothetical protein